MSLVLVGFRRVFWITRHLDLRYSTISSARPVYAFGSSACCLAVAALAIRATCIAGMFTRARFLPRMGLTCWALRPCFVSLWYFAICFGMGVPFQQLMISRTEDLHNANMPPAFVESCDLGHPLV